MSFLTAFCALTVILSIQHIFYGFCLLLLPLRCRLVVIFVVVVMFALTLANTGFLPSSIPIVQPIRLAWPRATLPPPAWCAEAWCVCMDGLRTAEFLKVSRWKQLSYTSHLLVNLPCMSFLSCLISVLFIYGALFIKQINYLISFFISRIRVFRTANRNKGYWEWGVKVRYNIWG
jgi:hypothetical protein